MVNSGLSTNYEAHRGLQPRHTKAAVGALVEGANEEASRRAANNAVFAAAAERGRLARKTPGPPTNTAARNAMAAAVANNRLGRGKRVSRTTGGRVKSKKSRKQKRSTKRRRN
jgi:hypothetical protein